MFFLLRLVALPLRFVGRNFRAFVVCMIGYSVLSGTLLLGLEGACSAFGAERLFHEESWNVSALWIAVSLAATALGAYVGGLLCQAVDRRGQAVLFLIMIVVLIGFATLQGAEEAPVAAREATLERMEIVRSAVRPMWVHILTPILAVAAVLAGAAQIKRRQQGAVGAVMQQGRPAAEAGQSTMSS